MDRHLLIARRGADGLRASVSACGASARVRMSSRNAGIDASGRRTTIWSSGAADHSRFRLAGIAGHFARAVLVDDTVAVVVDVVAADLRRGR